MLHKEAVDPNTLELIRQLIADHILSKFYLVGGTSLALQIGHRKSVDIDLFTNDDFDVLALMQYLEQTYSFHSDYSANNTLNGSIEDIKIDLITHNYNLIYPPQELDGVRMLSKEDIAAMKINVIAGNGTRSKDFIDLYFLLKEYSISELLNFYKLKYSQRNLAHVVKSIVYFNEIDTGDWPVMILEKRLSLSKLKKHITNSVSNSNLEIF